ncbi:helix-turn-helix transcriptional regulator [Longimicrobium sp.]|jgi:DNA-binding CsgD family transcriptional regulator|uniref:helix-turn-helix transcriptional regulator n=1 Tax=Longimicrobium sp. TaxID=2029185 RepID=UPI002F931887
MSLILNSAEVGRLTSTLQVLSSPFDAATPEQWVHDVQACVRELFAADHAIFIGMGDGGPRVVAEGYRTEFTDEAATVLTRPDPLNAAMDGRMRATGNEVFHDGRMLQAVGWEQKAAERTACWEVRESLGMIQAQGLYTHSLDHPSILYVSYGRRGAATYMEERGPMLMRMLLPSFKGALRALQRLRSRETDMAGLLDALPGATLVYDRAGREIGRNRACIGALGSDPEAATVTGEAQRLARSLCALRFPLCGRTDGDAFAPAERQVCTRRGAYRLSGTLWAGESEIAVVVSVDAPRALLPPGGVLQARWGLTAREAEVASLLSSGMTDRQVAAKLFISHSTARRHAEHILAKLGMKSRSGLALRLMQPV